MNNTNHRQQGDVILCKLSAMPEGERKLVASKHIVVAHGESGHSHVIEDDEAELIQVGERMILSLSKPATLKHEEHHEQTYEAGLWEVGRVREYDYVSKITRQVID